ncbi:putative lipoprotein, partial [Chlamydia psittaci 84-8471/1]
CCWPWIFPSNFKA